VAVIECSLQLPMQAVPITTDVVSSNLDQGEVYSIIWLIKHWYKLYFIWMERCLNQSHLKPLY
jgi:hypothetical protein